MGSRPNILWISTHDINPHLGTYAGVWPGASEAITPHLDRLAAEGVRFDQAIATAPVCAPSRASIYTGCQPTAVGTMHMRTKAVPPPEVVLLPELFREHGYFTSNNFFTDFQMDVPETTFDEIGFHAHWRGRPAADTPFFSAFHGMTTHESSIYLEEADFRKATARVPDDLRHDPHRITLPPYYPDTEPFRVAWARYLDLITEMDLWVADILAQLDEDGLSDNTIVVFWSDHGVGMPRAKRWATEAGLRVPLIVRWPGQVAGDTVVRHPVSLMDLAPTMLSFAGLPVPEHMQGHAFRIEDGNIVIDADYVFGGRDRMDEQEDCSRTVRDIRFRYTMHMHPDRSAMQHHAYADKFPTWAEFRRLAFEEAAQLADGILPSRMTALQRSIVAPHKPVEELYDISADPHETRNLVNDSQYSDDLARLRRVMSAWRERVPDLGNVPEAELLESWRPGGVTPRTGAVEAAVDAKGILTATCHTEGARIGWTTMPSGASTSGETVPHPMLKKLGIDTDGRHWKLYVGPTVIDKPVFVKAWRIGFEPSAEVAVAPPTSESAT